MRVKLVQTRDNRTAGTLWSKVLNGVDHSWDVNRLGHLDTQGRSNPLVAQRIIGCYTLNSERVQLEL